MPIACNAQPVFETLNIRPFSVDGASADGSRIIVHTGANGSVWDAVNGLRELPRLSSEYTQSVGYGISSDGRYISVQNVRSTSPRRQQSRFDVDNWTHQGIGFYNGNQSLEGFGISPDGNALPISVASGPPLSVARWRSGEGLTVLHTFDQLLINYPWDASINGEVVVGDLGINVTHRAYSTQNGFHYLDPLSPNDRTQAFAVSGDGSIAVGYSGSSAVAWVNDVPIAFPSISGTLSKEAQCMTLDGGVIGGDADIPAGTSRAWFWSESTGTVLLDQYLNALGMNVPTLATLDSISEDRRTFIGKTSDGYVYRATLQFPLSGAPIPAPAGVASLAIATLFASRRKRK